MKTRTQNVFMRHIQFGFVVLSVVFILDRLMKYWTVSQLMTKSIIVIPDILHFVYVPNPNLLYILNLPVWVTTIIVGGVMVALLFILRSSWRAGRTLEVIGMSSMLFGALSNIVDRLLYGSVVDMISVPFWSTFNIADIMIVVGALLVLRSSLQYSKVAEK
jgi:signal peptidase II